MLDVGVDSPILGQVLSLLLSAASTLLLAATGSAAAAEQGSSCDPKITFFPPGSEDKNFPTAWGRMAQLAAGNMNSSRMFSVVMPSASIIPGTHSLGYPTLQVYPIHDLLVLGRGNISEQCLGYNTGTSFPGPEKAEDLVVTVPPRYRVEYDFNGTNTITAGEYQQPTGVGTIPRIVLDQLATYPDVSRAACCAVASSKAATAAQTSRGGSSSSGQTVCCSCATWCQQADGCIHAGGSHAAWLLQQADRAVQTETGHKLFEAADERAVISSTYAIRCRLRALLHCWACWQVFVTLMSLLLLPILACRRTIV